MVDLGNSEVARVKTFAESGGWYYTIVLPTLGKEMTFEYLDLGYYHFDDCCECDGDDISIAMFSGIDDFLVKELEK